MSIPSRAALSRLFFGSLAVASAACSARSGEPETSGTEKVTVVEPPRASPSLSASASATASTSSSAPALDASRGAYARSFKTVDSLAKALPAGTELVGFVDYDADIVCSPGPCKPAWKHGIDQPSARGAIVRRGGVDDVITAETFAKVVGKVDSPEKAALRARLAEFAGMASCKSFRDAHLECAQGNSEKGMLVRAADGGGFEVAQFGRHNVCPEHMYGDMEAIGIVHVDAEGKIEEVDNALTREIAATASADGLCNPVHRGRMFEGFVDLACKETELDYYLRAQHEESAAVVAFERLAEELLLHGAPASLIDAAHEAANDERRHAKAFRREAERSFTALGRAPRFPELPIAELAARSLEAMLLENASEGCANETYAAVVATHQAEHAPSARLRSILAGIASDERAHAALAHRVHAWGVSRLDVDAARRVELARSAAVDQLHRVSTVDSLGLRMGEPAQAMALVAFDRVVYALARAAA